MAPAIWIPNFITLLTDAVQSALPMPTDDSKYATRFATLAMSRTHASPMYSRKRRGEGDFERSTVPEYLNHPHPTSPGVPNEEQDVPLTINFMRRELLRAYTVSQVEGRPDVRRIRTPESNSAAFGMVWACSAWNILAGGCADVEPFERLIEAQTTAGHFLKPTANDNLESWWYSELILLHAMGTYAAIARDPRAFTAVRRAAMYHLAETQPDHATNEPWAIFPFLLQPETRSLADQLLHNARMTPPTATSLMLLADALYCLKSQTNEGSQP